ncbi:MAG: FtsX-like permease family protein [Thermofilaceae archaeon]
MLRKGLPTIATIPLILATVLSLASIVQSTSQDSNITEIISSALRDFNYSSVLTYSNKISSLGSRAPGYPGYYKTIQFIIDEINKLQLNYKIFNFSFLAPLETESYVEVLEPIYIKFKAYSLWPHASFYASPGVKEGYAIYVGTGTLEDFDGKPVNGSIVLMEYDGSEDNWINAMRFGAKAVVFLGEGYPVREALKKFDPIVPVPFPRLYLEPKEATVLRSLVKERPIKVRIYTDMDLREVIGYNILVEIPGTMKTNEVILFVTHFDAWCVVPALANSTEQALSTAIMLEMLKYFSVNKPLRTAWFLFTSGYWNGLTGSREFVRKIILESPELVKGEKIIIYVIGLDISADFPVVSLLYVGHFYQAADRPYFTAKFAWIKGIVEGYLNDIVRKYLNDIGVPESQGLRNALTMLRGPIRSVDLIEGPGLAWASTQSQPYILDTEPFLIAGMAAFTMRTSYSYRPFFGEPFSDLFYVNINFRERVLPQVASAIALASSLLNEPEIRISKTLILPSRTHPLWYWGFYDLKVQVLEYNISSAWYDPVPNVIIRVGRWSTYPFVWMFARADNNGTALFYGISPQTINTWYIDAWKFINDSYAIVPALGMRSTGPTWVGFLVPTAYAATYVKAMRVGTLVDCYNPRLMRRFLEDPRYFSSNPWASGGTFSISYDTNIGITPLYYFFAMNDRSGVYLKAETFVVISTLTLSVGGRWPVGVASGERTRFWVYDYAYNTYLLTSERYYNVLFPREVRRLSAETLLNYSDQFIKAAKEALRMFNWSEAYRKALAAWGYSSRAYADETMPLYEECIRSAITLIPFISIAAYFTERLLIKGRGFKEIFNLILCEFIYFVVFAFIHPAFWVVPSATLAALALLMLILTSIIIWLFISEARGILAELSSKILGRHEVVRERMGAALVGLTLSTENIRKHRMRSILTIVPIITFSMALTSLASVSPYTAVLKQPAEIGSLPIYGYVIKRGLLPALDGYLDLPTIEAIKGLVGDRGIVCPRLVYYSPTTVEFGPYALLVSEKASVKIPAVIGLTPEEVAAVVSRAIVEGPSKPFLYEEQNAVLLPASLAKILNVSIGDVVELYGMKLIVTAIYDERILDQIRDPDGYSFAPVYSFFYPQLHGFPALGITAFPYPYSWSEIVILPAGLVRKMGGKVLSIVILLKDLLPEDDFDKLGEKLAFLVDATCYGVGTNGETVAYSRFPGYAAIGWVGMSILFVITALNIVVSLLGSVKERTREIFVYSSVGLSPSGAALMYLIEFSTYAFVGSVVGYYVGWFMGKLLRSFNVLPPDFVMNFASIGIAAVMTLTLLSTVLAAIYPSYYASRIITPSLERKWKLPAKPRGFEWEITLPFKIPSEREVKAILLYMREYYMGAGYSKVVHRVSSDIDVDLESKKISFNVMLYPFDSGTEEKVTLYFLRDPIGGWRANIKLQFLKGLRSIWEGESQYRFIDDLRKQLLLWGTLPSSEKAKYFKTV